MVELEFVKKDFNVGIAKIPSAFFKIRSVIEVKVPTGCSTKREEMRTLPRLSIAKPWLNSG